MYGGDDGLQPVRRGLQSVRGCGLQSVRGCGLQSVRGCGLQSVRGVGLQSVQSLRGRKPLRGGLGFSLVSSPGDAARACPPQREWRSSDFAGVRRRLT